MQIPIEIPQLAKLHIYFTNRCNQHCRHCWVEAAPTRRSRLHAEALNPQIDKAIQLGLATVKITGGEPLLFKEDVFSVLEHCWRRTLKTRLETNGTLIDDDVATRLRTFGVNVATSLDGASAETHDAFRRTEAGFAHTVRGIEDLIAKGVTVEVISCVHRDNAHEVDEIIDLCQRIGVSTLKFNFPSRYGRALHMSPRVDLLSTEETVKTVRKLECRERREANMAIDFDVPRALRLRPNAQRRCEVLNLLSILPDGRYSLCGIGVTRAELTFGDLRKHDIDAVWRSCGLLTQMRSTIPYSAEGICRDCTEYSLCLGHCTAHALSEFGSLNGPHPLCQDAFDKGFFPQDKIKGSCKVSAATS